jgi:hypothetical protein
MTYLNNILFPGVPYHIDMSFITSVPEPHIFEHAIDYDRIYISGAQIIKIQQALVQQSSAILADTEPNSAILKAVYSEGGKLGPVNWLKVKSPPYHDGVYTRTGDSSVLKNNGMFEPKMHSPKKR